MTRFRVAWLLARIKRQSQVAVYMTVYTKFKKILLNSGSGLLGQGNVQLQGGDLP